MIIVMEKQEQVFSCSICGFAVQSEPYNKSINAYTGKSKTKAVSALGWKGFISTDGGLIL